LLKIQTIRTVAKKGYLQHVGISIYEHHSHVYNPPRWFVTSGLEGSTMKTVEAKLELDHLREEIFNLRERQMHMDMELAELRAYKKQTKALVTQRKDDDHISDSDKRRMAEMDQALKQARADKVVLLQKLEQLQAKKAPDNNTPELHKQNLNLQQQNIQLQQQIMLLQEKIQQQDTLLTKQTQQTQQDIKQAHQAQQAEFDNQQKAQKAAFETQLAALRDTLSQRTGELQAARSAQQVAEQKQQQAEVQQSEAERQLQQAEKHNADLQRENEEMRDLVAHTMPAMSQQLSHDVDGFSQKMADFQQMLAQAQDMSEQWHGMMTVNQACTQVMQTLIDQYQVKQAISGSTWQSVNTALPKESGVYLLTDGKRQCVGYFNAQAAEFAATTLFKTPSHWMPQPAVPVA
jgi:DNA repair exonuclease SbcCD ATPase subunit